MQNDNSTTLNGNGKIHHLPHETFSLNLPEKIVPAADAQFDDETKMKLIAGHFRQIMLVLGLDLEDDSLKGTPARVVKTYVRETFKGVNPANKPAITLFENKYNYGEMPVEKNITLYSTCEHYFVPIIGKAHVAYYAAGKVIGLSKINRLVEHYSKKPQVQERLTEEIAAASKETLWTNDVAVMIDAAHLCVASRGVGDATSATVTKYSVI